MRVAKERPAEGLGHKVAEIIKLKGMLWDNIPDQRSYKGATPIAHTAVQRRRRRNIIVIEVKKNPSPVRQKRRGVFLD